MKKKFHFDFSCFDYNDRMRKSDYELETGGSNIVDNGGGTGTVIGPKTKNM